MKTRDYWYDNIKAILVILVIYGHIGIPLAGSSTFFRDFREFITLFHMPAFLIISGHLMRKRLDSKEVGKITFSYLLPYIISNFIMFLIFSYYGAVRVSGIQQSGFFNLFQPYYSLWFLAALFVYSIITIILKKSNKKMFFVIVLLLLTGFGVKIRFLELSKILPFYVYFYVGYSVDLSKLKPFLKSKLVIIVSAVLIFVSLCYAFGLENSVQNCVFSMECQYSEYDVSMLPIHPVLIRLGAVFLSIILSFSLFSIIPSRKNLFSFIGVNSISPFIMQTFLMVVYFYGVKRSLVLQIDNTLMYFLSFVIMMFFILVFSTDWFTKKLSKIVKPDIKKIFGGDSLG